MSFELSSKNYRDRLSNHKYNSKFKRRNLKAVKNVSAANTKNLQSAVRLRPHFYDA